MGGERKKEGEVISKRELQALLLIF